MSHLHVFDMDGTLLRGSASLELSRRTRHQERTAELEARWREGQLGVTQYWDAVLTSWEGLSERDIDAAFEEAPWLTGIREVFGDIAVRGEHVAVISQSPAFFVRRLRRWGAEWTFGADVQIGVPAVRSMLVSRRHKVEITSRLLDELGLGTSSCTAYGDSTSDELLFEFVTSSVGVNPNSALRVTPTAVYRGDDLRAAYALGRSLRARDQDDDASSDSSAALGGRAS